MFTQPVTGGFGWWWLHHGVLRFCVSDDSDELQAAEEAPRPGNRSKPVVDDACYSNRVKTQLGGMACCCDCRPGTPKTYILRVAEPAPPADPGVEILAENRLKSTHVMSLT